MQIKIVNAFTIVAFSILLLASLTATVLYRADANASRTMGAPCYSMNCHAMNPAHWL